MTELEQRAAQMKWNPPAPGSEARKQMPSSAFLSPSTRTYPYKILIDGEWVISEPALRSIISIANFRDNPIIQAKASKLLESLQSDNELKHYGIMGMKWGRRRARDSRTGLIIDSLDQRQQKLREKHRIQTKKQAIALKKKKIKEQKKAFKQKMANQNKPTKEAKETKEQPKMDPDAAKVRALKNKGVDNLSNSELKAYVERMNLEKQYSQLNKKEISRGKAFVDRNLEKFADQTAQMVFKELVLKPGVSAITKGTKK